MEQTLLHLKDLLEKEFHGFELTQRLQFDWLQGIEAELDIFEEDPFEENPQTEIVSPLPLPLPVGEMPVVHDSVVLSDSDSDFATEFPLLTQEDQKVLKFDGKECFGISNEKECETPPVVKKGSKDNKTVVRTQGSPRRGRLCSPKRPRNGRTDLAVVGRRVRV
jgi:hypothetical protein